MNRMDFNKLKLNSDGLLPVVTQDYSSNEVLMVAYMNKEAFNKTIETKKVHYFSRSRQSLWLKGETSGHYQHLVSMALDCDNDTLLVKVKQEGAACHTGNYSCFYKNIDIDNKEVLESSELQQKKQNVFEIFEEVYNVIADRKENPKEGSYTNYLFDKGIDKILKKVGEESAEVIIGAKNEGNDEIIYEISDLIYHLSVLMVEKNTTWEDICKELNKRR
ncbi:bifunctional phosphoribosyl-AMP cyclohydrolase/phosphoribosyl-ATP diphosphatase HisIE [Vallitalea guaymasensis]|uniref:Histidine biosynthesis bifunctional protein HisIE n=1 Tax=Vallitalea guaymasensis TaxID=1185412 RepID=A0A8J8MEN6_9FIRM|nr:bifunctional phosphoribosyl-AMP cyclohydrolase/phosphoribosyl-ATP diphosphatase HisIE [Vallitalea guaymasensis]QUH31536.1 bifunctional phosphoribosyl-AMP cyclohydrolase/phosphoribosyl-ATP diphosphatase HisIE [Vallitalea guaymasensis]